MLCFVDDGSWWIDDDYDCAEEMRKRWCPLDYGRDDDGDDDDDGGDDDYGGDDASLMPPGLWWRVGRGTVKD